MLLKQYFERKIKWEPSDLQLSAVTRNKTFFTAVFYEYALCTLIIGFVLQPLLKFANPVYAFGTGVVLALTVRQIYRVNVVSTVFPRLKRWLSVFFMIVLSVIFAVMAGLLLGFAFSNSIAHDEYCLSLQTRIQRGNDSEANSTIFSNMQCRVQLPERRY
ncbi:hypothetical protein [Brenneria corticis]|nr:hypothetical protein [Brenneria sp. CFCC 11842]